MRSAQLYLHFEKGYKNKKRKDSIVKAPVRRFFSFPQAYNTSATPLERLTPLGSNAVVDIICLQVSPIWIVFESSF